MRRASWLLVPILTLGLGAAPVRAASDPVIDVDTFGLELCPQSVCGAAIFAGFLSGRVGSRPNASGTFIVAVRHDPELPDVPGESIFLRGGRFELQVGRRTFKGVIADPGGTLTYLGENRFQVQATLIFTEGASGTAEYTGILDHNYFPPIVVGPITQ